MISRFQNAILTGLVLGYVELAIWLFGKVFPR